MSKANELLPLPLTPVKTINRYTAKEQYQHPIEGEARVWFSKYFGLYKIFCKDGEKTTIADSKFGSQDIDYKSWFTHRNDNEHYEDDINDPDSVRNTEMHRNQGKWSGEVGDRKLNKISPIQEKLIAAGHKEEDLIKLMEKNQNRPKVTDLLKIFKK